MAKEYKINFTANAITLGHVLGGLATSYRNMPASAPEEVSYNLRYLIINILDQLMEKGVDVIKPRSPFYSYSKLVNFERYLELFDKKQR